MHAIEIAARHRQITRLLGAAGQHHRVKILVQLLRRDRFFGPVGDLGIMGQRAHHHTTAKRHTFGSHLLNPAVNMDLFHFEVWNAVAQQAANPVVLFKQRHIVTRTGQLLGGRHASGPRAHNSDFFAGFMLGDTRRDPAFRPGAVDDGVLNGFDPDRLIVDIEHTSCFAGRWTNPACEFRKIIRAVQRVNRVLPVGTKHHVVEVGDDVVDRAAAVAKRRATVHAASGLLAGVRVIQANDEFLVVLQALVHGLVALFDALEIHKTGDFSHDPFLWCVFSVFSTLLSIKSAGGPGF